MGMSRRAAAISVALGTYALLFGLAQFLAPRSCRGGFLAYVCSGVVAALLLLGIPFVFERRLPVVARAAMSLAFLLAGVAVWWASALATHFAVACF